jgi:predicted GH43/DUF377 family glycosyl hydrolase
MKIDSIFEETVFKKIKKTFRQRKHVACPDEGFEAEVQKNALSFAAFKKRDPRVKIASIEDGYDVVFSEDHLAFDLASLIMESNPNINLKFSQDLLDFEPEEELVMKSKVPLWIIEHVGPSKKRVQIKRVW